MKKLMTLGAAALCAAVSLADVTSANVVGYGNSQLRNGSKMVGFFFNKIGDKGMRLSDLSVNGYLDVAYFQHNARKGIKQNIFTVTVLNASGGTAKYENGQPKQWCFRRSCTNIGGVWTWGNDARWTYQNDDTHDIVPGSDEDYKFGVGEALWFDISDNAFTGVENPNKYTLLNNGEAILDAQQVPVRNGSKGISIPVSKGGVRLSQIAPVGYLDVAYFQHNARKGIKQNIFTLTILNASGGTAKYENGQPKQWCFRRSCTNVGGVWTWGNDARWTLQSDDTHDIVPGSDEDYVFEIGEGIWFDVADNAYTGDVPADKYSVEFPGIDDEVKTEE